MIDSDLNHGILNQVSANSETKE